MTETAAVHIEDLRVRFGDKRVVDSISLTLGPAERLAVLGASGSGKTTLLRAVAGLIEDFETGRVHIAGRLASDEAGLKLQPHERGLAMVFQDLALWPHMDVRAHLRFAVGPAAEAAHIDDWLSRVGLDGRARSRPAQLSGGERQRLALARALISRPRCLLLDEPFSSLDLPLRQEMLALLLSLQRAEAFALIHVTHDPEEALRMAPRLVFLHEGRVLFDGAAGDLLRSEAPELVRLAAALDWWKSPDAGRGA